MGMQVVILLVSTLPIGLLVAVTYLTLVWRKRRSRLPFSFSATSRIPGYQLLKQYNDLGFDAVGGFVMVQFLIAYPFIAHYVAEQFGSRTSFLMLSLIISPAIIYQLVKTCRTLLRRGNIRLGLEAEWYVGHQLNEISELGYRSFHDVQGDGFNIDHLVVGPNGVFAIETKGRRKPGSEKKANPLKDNSHQLSLNGETLVFPHMTDNSTIPQAIRQAKWCSQWLTQATGQPVKVMPVVALPGWFIKRESKPIIPILSAKELPNTIPKLRSELLSDSAKSQIIHQIKQRISRDSDEL